MHFLKILFAATFAMPVATGAFANDADFKLKNRTGYQIDEVYVAAHSSNRWGRDIMGKQTLEDGHNLSVTFPHGNGACDFDIKVKYDDDTTAEWRDIDLCKYEAVSLYWDAKKQATRAVGE